MEHRISFRGFDPLAKLTVTEQRLPHWIQEGAAYFITFRLADSVPAHLQRQWSDERNIWLQWHPPPWSEVIEAEYHARFTEQMDIWLDAGMGNCHLRQGRVRQQAEKHLRHFDGIRYDLDAFVMMPNHVHALLIPRTGQRLFKLIQGIKGVSARTCNQLLGRTGDSFWMEDSYNRIVRDGRELLAFRRYIEENAVKAKLREGEFTLAMNNRLYIPGVDDPEQ